MGCNHEHGKGLSHHDAELVLKLYDLRRETVMRESRHKLAFEFWPKNWDEFSAVMKMDQPISVAFRQVTSYWEMAYSFAKHGIVNPDFMAENAGEGLFIYGKFEPFVEQFRSEMSQTAFRNVEWLIANSTEAQERMKMICARIKSINEKK